MQNSFICTQFVNHVAALTLCSVIVAGDAVSPHLLNPPSWRFCLHIDTPVGRGGVGERRACSIANLLPVFSSGRGARATIGITGRATMSSTAAWMIWSSSPRSQKTPLWRTSRSDTWMTLFLYPSLGLWDRLSRPASIYSPAFKPEEGQGWSLLF